MSDETKVIDENTDLPSMDEGMTGSFYEGLRLLQEWRPKLQAREDIGHKVATGAPVTEEEARMQLAVCDEVDQLGLRGIGQVLAHLMTLRDQAIIVTEMLVEEMHNHFSDEIAEMQRRAGMAVTDGEADPFAAGVREVA